MTTANFLQAKGNEVVVYERDAQPGGLIKCRRINGSLFHTCGGHVFNSKRQEVLDWFWTKFKKEEDFVKADRNSCVFMDKNNNSLEHDDIPYPLENHIYLFDAETQNKFYNDLEEIDNVKGFNAHFTDYDNFGNFLRWRFGKTLYDIYFQPYNEKVWRRDLTTVPMSWMEGKLPMPTTQEMRDNNANKVEEKKFVHSTFWYEKKNGSQFIADKLANNLNIRYNENIYDIRYIDGKWYVSGKLFDKVVFCGNVKEMIADIDIDPSYGSFVINTEGELVGWIKPEGKTGGYGYERVIGISDYLDVIETISNGTEFAYLGLKAQEMSQEMDEAGLPEGLYIRESIQNSPAYDSGIQNGDVLVGINDREIRKMADYHEALKELHVGDEADVTVMRQNGAEYVSVHFSVIVAGR